jgi:hypothetical protein
MPAALAITERSREEVFLRRETELVLATHSRHLTCDNLVDGSQVENCDSLERRRARSRSIGPRYFTSGAQMYPPGSREHMVRKGFIDGVIANLVARR